MKRYLAILLALLCIPLFTYGDTSLLLGDANGDGTVQSDDAAVVLRHVVSLQSISDAYTLSADCDQNGSVSSADAAAILRHVVGLTDATSSPATDAPTEPTATPDAASTDNTATTDDPTATPVPDPTEEIAPTEEPIVTPSPEPPPIPKPALSGKTVILDAGHGYNPTRDVYYGGSVSREDGSLYIEANTVLDIALKTKAFLEAEGATVFMIRSETNMVGNYVRMAKVHQHCLERLSEQTENVELLSEYERLYGIMESIINEYNLKTDANGDLAKTYFDTPYDSTMQRAMHPDMLKLFTLETDALFSDTIFLSLHTNASSDSTKRGIDVYCMNNTFNPNYCTSYQAEKNLALGTAMLETLHGSSGIPNHWEYVAVNDYFMIREHNIPAALLEMGYHTNAEDRAILDSEAGRSGLAEGIKNGVILYFKNN